MWNHGREKQNKSRNGRKRKWDSTSIPPVDWINQSAHQCKWGNHEPKIREWKIAEWPKFWKATQWEDDEISNIHESIEWEKYL